ncbi:MAG: hypothetical protein Solivirus2_1, partial [Solivirus sp.]
MSVYTEISQCRICEGELEDVINLGHHAITSRFPKQDEPNPPSSPL